MKRVFRISDIGSARSELRGFFTPKFPTNPTTMPTTTRRVSTESSSSKSILDLYGQFANRWTYSDVRSKEEMVEKVSFYRDELIKNVKDENCFENLLEVEGWNLIKMYSDGAAFVELLKLLESSPHLAIKVFNWRRKKDQTRPLSSEEYAKGIKIAGRIKDVDLAVELFTEASNKQLKNTSTYNALMGYLTAWMWDSMETTYRMMETGPVHANLDTRLLMLRGYAHSGNLEKMEEIYNIVGPHVLREKHISLIRAMICAYCNFPNRNRVKRINELMRLIPENQYRPWLNVLLIRVYAEEDLVDQMDESIDEAFDHNTTINTVRIMRMITSTYIQNNDVDKLAKFITRAGHSGWRMCRRLYHELMWVLAKQKRIEEMEQVLFEMERYNYGCSKRTFIILYKAYSAHEERYRPKLYRVVGLMYKYGYGSFLANIRI
ncbi:putative pentatricopeptide repeat-containing protein PPR5 [Helianthus debilis subsp. tardiflorus]